MKRMGSLQSILKEQRGEEAAKLSPALQLLDCLRCTKLSFPSLPIKRTVLWFAPSPQYAAVAVSTIEGLTQQSTHLSPYFWPLCHSSNLGKNGHMYRACNLFVSMDTRLVVVFPLFSEAEGNDDEIWADTVHGCVSHWIGTGNVIIVYTGLVDNECPLSSSPCLSSATATNTSPESMNSASPTAPLSGPIVYKTSFCTEDLMTKLKEKETREDGWSTDGFGEMQGELELCNQSLWLRKLLLEIEKGESSEWLKALQWGELTSSLSPYQISRLSENLSFWENDELKDYLLSTRQWKIVPDSLLGVIPSTHVADVILQNIPPSPCSSMTLPDQLTFNVREELGDNVPPVFRGLNHPTLVTSGVVPAHLATPTMCHLATRACCKLTVECLLMHINNQ